MNREERIEALDVDSWPRVHQVDLLHHLLWSLGNAADAFAGATDFERGMHEEAVNLFDRAMDVAEDIAKGARRCAA